MMFLDACIITAILAYTVTWLWYIRAYMRYDFRAPFRRKLDYEFVTDEELTDICEKVTDIKKCRCNTILKMMFLAGPFAWIVILMVLLVGKLVVRVDKDYESTGTDLL